MKKEIINGLIIDEEGTKFWYLNDKLHRDDDLPAVEWTHGTKEWWVNGERHRENGLPAIVHTDGSVEYWEHGKQITKKRSEKIRAIND